MKLKIVDQGILSHQPGRCVIMPSITQLPDGSLIACQNVGTKFASSDFCIEVLKANGTGQAWLNLGNIYEDQNDLTWSYLGGSISELPDGQLVLASTRFESAPGSLFDPDSEALKRGETVLIWSNDRGETWSSPQVVPVDLPPERYTWNNSGRIVQFSPTRWMYPLETWKPAGYAGQPDQKAGAVFSSDQGHTWNNFTVITDDPEGRLLWWDQQSTQLADGRTYIMLWTHCYGTKDDLPVHWVASNDQGKTWSLPRPTNLRGQVCCPIGLPDGRVAAIYNFRHDPQGIRVALSENFEDFDLGTEVTVFDAKSEATLGSTEHENFLAEHQLIGFGKPQGILLDNGEILASYWCTVEGVTHSRWVRLRV